MGEIITTLEIVTERIIALRKTRAIIREELYGIRSYCAERYQKNKEVVLQRNLEWHINNREKHNAANKANNRQKRKEQQERLKELRAKILSDKLQTKINPL
jgi:hypothetical protein